VYVRKEADMHTTEPSHDAADPTEPLPVGISQLPFTALGGQPAWDPAAMERFVGAARIAVLSYVRHDGRPGQAPIWYVYRDGRFHLNVATGSPKHRALLRDPRVCVTIQDERPPYRAVIFDSVAELSDQATRAATAGIEDRYFGRIGGRAYRDLSAAEFAESGHTEIELRPTQVRGFDNTNGLNAATVWFLRARPHLPLLRRFL
jgi:PPOX class probable F420-dependent enzyme